MIKRVIATLAVAAVAAACGPNDGQVPTLQPEVSFPTSPEFSDPAGASPSLAPSLDPSMEPSLEPLPTASVAPEPQS